MQHQRPLVNILWTGGWDSTFRLLSLVDRPVSIQPYYLRDNRPSEPNELAAMSSISRALEPMLAPQTTLLPVVELHTSDVPEDPEISQAYERLREQQFLGSQYDWLGRFARSVDGLELCVHRDDKAFGVIQAFGGVVGRDDPDLGFYHVLDPERSSSDLQKVFGCFRFPVLYKSKLDMLDEVKARGRREILEQSWFCYQPVNGKPCGACNPCVYSIEEGMAFRFTPEALQRYRLEKVKRWLIHGLEAAHLKEPIKRILGRRTA
ncbi:hypothetical protein [Thioalkalivibrio sp. ALJ24]|uniref:hypothetical protein n=1 Tax=Thioalkalivibrio sp. ALJ24 TaxID=545276 RepID=UPI0012E9BEED|nr:hypothetical protein [Thioalkalivibrio sp. ALJ24]